MSTFVGYILAEGEYVNVGTAPRQQPGTLAACVARLLCAAGIASILWAPQLAGEPFSGKRGLAAGVLGVLTLLVLLQSDASVVSAGATVDARRGRQSISWSAQSRSLSTPALLLVGSLTAIWLTGGWGGPLATLAVLPALMFDTALGGFGVLGIGATVTMAGIVLAIFAYIPASPAIWSASQVYATVCMPTVWAMFAAVVFWLRVLWDERHRLAFSREPQPSLHFGLWNLARVSHELLTPVAAIQTGAGLLAGAASTVGGTLPGTSVGAKVARGKMMLDQAVTRRIAANVWRNAARLTLLTEDVLELARWSEAPPQLELGWHPCATTLSRATDAVALLFESRNQRLVGAVTPPDLCYWGDARRIEQVLVNLLANAHRYAGDGACITVGARTWEGGVRWEVWDDGPGLDDQTLTRILDPSCRITAHTVQHDGPRAPVDAEEQDHSGHGLGLMIVSALVELHGGSLWGENLAGRGCRFVVWLSGCRNALTDNTPGEKHSAGNAYGQSASEEAAP